MTPGRVDARRKPFVPVTVLDNQSKPHTIQFILVTGFTGQLLLPNRYINRLGLSMQLDSEPLLGMEFLWNNRITIDAVTDGAVSITPLGG